MIRPIEQDGPPPAAGTDPTVVVEQWFEAAGRSLEGGGAIVRCGRWWVEPVGGWRRGVRLWRVHDEGGACRAYVKRLPDRRRLARHVTAAGWLGDGDGRGIFAPAVLGYCGQRMMVATEAVSGRTAGWWLVRVGRYDRLGQWGRMSPEQLGRSLAEGLAGLYGGAGQAGFEPPGSWQDYRPRANGRRLLAKWRRLCGVAGSEAEAMREAVEAVAGRLAAMEGPVGPMLGDAHAGNLLMSEGGMCVVDLEDWGWGDWRRDVCFLLDRLADAAARWTYSRRRVGGVMGQVAGHPLLGRAMAVRRWYRVEFLVDAWWSSCRAEGQGALPRHGRSAAAVADQLRRLLEELAGEVARSQA